MSLNKEEVARQHEAIGVHQGDVVKDVTVHPDAQWFANAGLGLFLHWGIPSVRGECDLSWGMIYPRPGSFQKWREKYGPQGPGKVMSPNEYWEQAKSFFADRFDPDKILSAAKRAGFKYAVLTTKHHDGFALWPSAYGDFSVKNHLNGRDLVGEFVAACRRSGLKAGLYFSMPDWRVNKDLMSFHYGSIDYFRKRVQDGCEPCLGPDHEPVELKRLDDDEYARWTAKLRAFCRAQLEELLVRYGKIDLLWFDGNEPGAISKERIHELQPGIVVNNRMGFGDYLTPEGAFPERRPEGWWELCHAWNEGGWGYRSHEIYSPASWAVAELARVRAWGGNFLLNMAPDSHGELPSVAYKRLAELEGWMDKCRESVEGVSAGPWPEKCDVPVTCREGVWYLHLSWLWDSPVELRGTGRAPRSARALISGAPVDLTPIEGGARLFIPQNRISALGEVVKIEWERTPCSRSDGTWTLRAKSRSI